MPVTITGSTGVVSPNVRSNKYLDAAGSNTATLNSKTPIVTADIAVLSVAANLIANTATTSGGRVNITGLDLSSYDAVLCVPVGVQFTTTGNVNESMQIGPAGNMVTLHRSRSPTSIQINGAVMLYLDSGRVHSMVEANTSGILNDGVYIGNTGYTRTNTTISFAWTGTGTFRAGYIKLYGVK